MDLGRSWAQFGRGLGRSGASVGRSWAPLGHFLGIHIRAFVQHWPKMGSKRASGSTLGRFGKGFGRIWAGFWRVLGGFGPIWGPLSLQTSIGLAQVCMYILYKYRHSLSRSQCLHLGATYPRWLPVGPNLWHARVYNLLPLLPYT